MAQFNLLILPALPIFRQLQIEEALLRADTRNWCILNTGSEEGVVMGISGKPEELLDLNLIKQDGISVIRRFSGGGTVFVNPSTIFATLICNAEDSSVLLQPKSILEWTEKLYRPLFPTFSIKENDYVFGEKKFGGNAQYIQKNRWLHHTSFLWDYEAKKMDYLLMPKKRPAYRSGRSHTDFLCTLRTYFPSKEELLEKMRSHFLKHFSAKEIDLLDISEVLEKPHRKATTYLEIF